MVVKKIDPWPTIAGLLLIVIAGVFVYTFNDTTNYRRQLRDLKLEKDSLQAIIDNRQKEIDSLLNKINLFVIIDTVKYREDIIKKISKQHEKQINIIYLNSRNENIELLRKNLKQKNNEE